MVFLYLLKFSLLFIKQTQFKILEIEEWYHHMGIFDYSSEAIDDNMRILDNNLLSCLHKHLIGWWILPNKEHIHNTNYLQFSFDIIKI